MPGVIMEKDQDDEGNDNDLKMEDIASPQRSILEFFKSPTKLTEKPKNLLSYFGKPSSKEIDITKPKSSKDAPENNTNENMNGTHNGIKSKETEKKKKTESDNSKTKLVKVERKKGTKKSLSLGMKNESSPKRNDEMIDSDDIGKACGKDTEEGGIKKNGIQNGINSKDKEKNKKTESDNSKTKLVKVERKKGTKKSLSLGMKNESSPKRNGDINGKVKAGGKDTEECGNEKGLKNCTRKESMSKKKSKDKDEKLLNNKKEESDQKLENKSDEISGINYLDFLKTLDDQSDKNDDGLTEGSVQTEMADEIDNETETDNQTTENCQEIRINYLNIASYFTKVSGSATNKPPAKCNSPTIMTTADIHIEPTPCKINEANNSITVKKCSPLVNDTKLNEIEILSSEVVTVDSPLKTPKGRKKGTARKSLNKKLAAETIEISDDSFSVDNNTDNQEAEERKKVFLQSNNKSSSLQKTSQATLSFTKGGLQMTNKTAHMTRVRKSECEEVVSIESPLSKSTPVKRGRGRPQGSTKQRKENTSEDQKIKTNKDVSQQSSERNIKEKTTNRRISLRKKYKVDMINIDTKNRTPIRMRLIRCNKSGSSTDESFVSIKNKTNLKQSKAQQLLDKAKRTKSTKSPEQKRLIDKKLKKKGGKLKDSRKKEATEPKDKSDNTGRRRSSRLSGILQKSMDESQEEDDVMIIECEDEIDGGRKKKNLKDLSTPRREKKSSMSKTSRQNKTPCIGTPKKPAGKLAPIFMKKKEVEEPKKVILDPEQERLRREFLMSGVPEALKKQTVAASAAAINSDFCPFPAIKHVQQEDGIVGKSGIDIWKLSGVELKYITSSNECQSAFPKTFWKKNFLEKDNIMCDLTNLKKFSQHPKIEERLCEPLLKEIQRVSPSYNVDKMYKLLKEKKEDQDAEMTTEVEEQKENKSDKDHTEVDQKVNKKSRRRSLRLKKKDEVMEIIDLGSPEPVNKEETSSSDNKQEIAIVVPWTDKYQPTHSSEIVGNSNNVKKLKAWLIEWKHRVSKENRKMRKIMMKERKNKTKDKAVENDWWAEDDSDFDINSEDSEEEEDNRLCNTVMLMGPSGVGKTTAVYALAQEIGFKVSEVNASSTRNGKRILSQLQEATQSHRVSQNKGEGGQLLSSLTPSKKLSPQKKPEKKLPTSFANFFKKADNTSSVDVEKQKKSKNDIKGKKRKRDIEDSDVDKTPKKKKEKKEEKGVKFNSLIPTTSNQATASNQGLNLASTSLILFEDVDIVFEEDRGFWSAIQMFMSTTKIPIVLTTNNVTLSSKFDGRYEQYLFKTPSMKQTTVYLQLVCLAENIRTNSEEIMTLVKILSGDIRRCLLALQYWIDSGGGTLQQSQKIISPAKLKPLPVCEDVCSKDKAKQLISTQDENSKSRLCDDDDDDDFVSIKPVVNRRKRPLISDDESSNSALTFPTAMESLGKPELILQSNTHLSCLNSSLGLSLGGSQGILNLLMQLMKGHDDDLITMVTKACDQYRKLMYNIVYNTYIDLLPMPKSHNTCPPTLKSSKMKEKKPQLKRIKTFDLYDSEASNEGILDEPVEENVEETITEESKEEVIAVIKSLDGLTEFYDNMSFIDSITIGTEVPDSSNSYILHSKRNFNDTDATNTLEHIEKDNLSSEIEVRALYKLCTQQKQIQDSFKGQHLESLSIPSICSQSGGALVNRASNSANLVLKKASNNILSNLPLTVRCHQRSVIMDYVPTLREICKAEKLRELAKVKRRFHHYFDSIGLNLKDTTLDVMYTSFQ